MIQGWILEEQNTRLPYLREKTAQLTTSPGVYLMKNAAELRAVFENSWRVRAVFTVHQHSGGGSDVNGILYYSLRGLVLNAGADENSYAVVSVFPSGKVTVTGYRKAKSR